jgi:16S rRNA processing protein RimM
MPDAGPLEGEIPVGKIGRPRGNRGEVLLHAYFDLQKEKLEGKEVTVRLPAGKERRLTIESIWQHGEQAVCRFAECGSIAEAKELTHGEVLLPREELAPLEEDEYYAQDLIGCEVFLSVGSRLGTIEAVEQTGSSALLAISGEKEYLVPLVRSIVVEVDTAGRKVVIDPPEGLLEINED